METEVNNSIVSEYEDEVDSNHSSDAQESNDDKSDDYASEVD